MKGKSRHMHEASTPGSDVEALRRDERHKRTRYAKVIGSAGENSVHTYRPLDRQSTWKQIRRVRERKV